MTSFFIVDDDHIQNEFYRMALKLRGYEIAGYAYNGKECLDKLCNGHKGHYKIPEYVIMDHRMPIRNGLETINKLLELKPDIKIIIISADKSIKRNALSAGAVAFLSKPINFGQFISNIERIIQEN